MEQAELFNFDEPITLEEVFEAYFECRKRKRGTLNVLSFEIDFEHNLIELWQQINRIKHIKSVGPLRLLSTSLLNVKFLQLISETGLYII